jgi:fructose-specific phosphotransferase system IIC component
MSFVQETGRVFKDAGLHLRTGVSYMLPFLLIGGFVGSIASLASQLSTAHAWVVLRQVGEIGVSYFIVVMSGYIAYSIASNAGIAPGLIVGFIAKQNDLGYLGALLGGFLAGYATHMLMRVKLPQILRSTWGMVAPVFSTVATVLFLVFVVGVPVAHFMRWARQFLLSLEAQGGGALGVVMGVLGGLDFGGPCSKVQSTFATAAMDMKILTPLGIAGAIVTVPPLGMCVAAAIAPRLYSESERAYAKQSWVYALIGGFTEIVIPLAARDLWRVTVASVLGCAVTGAIAGGLALQLSTPVLGLPQWFFYDRPLVYWVSLVAGVVVVALVANTLKRWRTHESSDVEELASTQASTQTRRIAVVTSCIAGVAQSHMAAVALKREAERRGHTVFVEEQGGHKQTNQMNEQEIASAEIVIFARAIAIAGRERFDGKKTLELPVNKALLDPRGTIDKG